MSAHYQGPHGGVPRLPKSLPSLNLHRVGETYNLVVWSGAEIFVIIVCGSIPPLKALWDRYVSKSKRHNYGQCASPQYGRGAMDINGGYHVMRRNADHNVSSCVSSTEKEHDIGASEKKGHVELGIMAVTDIEVMSVRKLAREVG